jgi:tetratricopeptide (TPR) repeat protein
MGGEQGNKAFYEAKKPPGGAVGRQLDESRLRKHSVGWTWVAVMSVRRRVRDDLGEAENAVSSVQKNRVECVSVSTGTGVVAGNEYAPRERMRSWVHGLAVSGLVLAGVAVYANALRGPFVFDDGAAILENPTIRNLRELGAVLSPPSGAGVTVGGRPLLNLTLALNYAVGGTTPWGYHAVNVAIHVLAGLTLFGLVRRVMNGPVLRARWAEQVLVIAWSVALLWLVHPLQTESVTYVVQRAESLVGLFYLLTLYAFVRSAESERTAKKWQVASVAACLAGMATKEVMVSAPLIVLLCDRIFFAGSWRAAWRARRGYYGALAATWVLLGWLVAGADNRGGTAGFGVAMTSAEYALTQCSAIWHYLQLAAWPTPLVFDYGIGVMREPLAVVGLVVLVGATLVALVRWPVRGFLAACFFAILAPSSSVVPVASQTMAEHRMYLPLAAVIVAGVVGLWTWLGRRALIVVAMIAVVWSSMTVQRNRVYQSELALWTDTVAHRPENARAHNNLGNALLQAGRNDEAGAEFAAALRLSPDYADAHNNAGYVLARAGRVADAMVHYEAALRLKPESVEVLTNLGSALVRSGRVQEALVHYEHALRISPGANGTRYNLGNARLALNDWAGAVRDYEEVVRRAPDHVDAQVNLAAVLLVLDRAGESLVHAEAAVRLSPNLAEGYFHAGNALVRLNRGAEAIPRYEAALRLQPDFVAAREQLNRLQAMRGANRQ